MTSIIVVRNALTTDERIEVVNEEHKTHFPRPDGYWSETFAFTVAPVNGVFTANALQELMLDLVPLPPTTKDDFRDGDSTISFGKLYFDEEIGHVVVDEVKNYKITDPLFKGEGLENGELKLERHDTQALRRRTWVYLYPTIDYALRVLNKDAGKYSAKYEELVEVGQRVRG